MSSSAPDLEPPSYTTCDGVSDRCPVSATVYGDYFTTGACAFFVAAHALLLAAQVYLGWRSKAWSFAAYLALGTAFELMGYAARIAMSYNPWSYEGFVIQLLMLILGPTLVAAAISVTFKHLVLWHGPQWSFIRPRLYPWVFVGTDFFSIVIQAAGGGVSSVATDGDDPDQGLLDVGSGLLVAGVVFQVANMVFCGGLMLLYIWRRHRALKKSEGASRAAAPAVVDGPGGGGETSSSVASGRVGPGAAGKTYRPKDPKVQKFIWAITGAYIAIIVRCIYRIPEMQTGWASELMQNETLFLILDGAMILAAVLTLTVFHPAFFFPFLGKGKGRVPVEDEAPAQGQPEMRAVQA
ncbi:Efflux pump himE like protein [Verticillium longisporum]|nr:Efflux pump himE like protein [Verticillium longisporum]